MSKYHVVSSGMVTRQALPSITRQRGTTTGSANLMLYGAGKTTVSNNTTFIDSSANAFTVTRNGDTVQSGFNPFSQASSGSGYFDGTGDYLSLANNAAFDLGTGDFTIECFVNTQVVSGTAIIFCKHSSATGTWIIYRNASTIQFFCSSTGSSWDICNGVTVGTVSTNTWYHVAVSRSGTSIRSFLNGVIGNTTTSSAALFNGTQVVALGANNIGADFFNGYISNARVVKGTAVYTSNFTPPTSPLTAITNTSLLLLTDNYSIVNSTSTNLPVTINGGASISTAQFPTGMSSSLLFNGTTGYLSFPSNSAFAFGSGDFTIEYWLYASSWSPSFYTVFDTRTTGLSSGYSDYINGSGVFNIYINNSTIYTMTGSLSTNTWTHIAVSRSGTSLRVFINGTQNGSTVTNSTNLSDTNLLVAVNRGSTAGTISTSFFNGYISNVRVCKGTALYTANFTPPSLPMSTTVTVPAFVTNAIYGVNQIP